MANLISYHGGKQLPYLTPLTLYASISWPDASSAAWDPTDTRRCQIDTFFHDFLLSSYIDAMREHLPVAGLYWNPGPYLGNGVLQVTPKVVSSKNLGSDLTIDDVDIQAALLAALATGLASSDWMFYCVMLPDNVVVIDHGARSDDPNNGFQGYHSAIDDPKNKHPLYYCVIVSGEIDDLTYRLSHETVETMTNPDHYGWFGTPDALENTFLGLPADAEPEICDYSERPQQIATIHGWQVAPFCYEFDVVTTPTGEDITQLMAPISDDVAVSDGNRGTIGLVPLLTLKTSCFGSLIEGQTVLFSATAFRWATVTPIAAGSWSFDCTPPDTVTQPYGNEGPIYALTIADGCTSIALECLITTGLGCQFTVMQNFSVVTQPQAQEEEPLCALARRIKGEHWYNPLWWIEKYLPEFNPKARELEDYIARIAAEQGVSPRGVERLQAVVGADISQRLAAMIAAFQAEDHRI